VPKYRFTTSNGDTFEVSPGHLQLPDAMRACQPRRGRDPNRNLLL